VLLARNFLLTSIDTFAAGCIVLPQNAAKNELPKLLLCVEYSYKQVKNATHCTARSTVCKRKVVYFRCLQSTNDVKISSTIGLLSNSYAVVCCCRDDEQKYQQFVKNVTSDILRRGIYTNRSEKLFRQFRFVFVPSANEVT